jgi:polysaccharide export outer membrane protein
MNLYNMKLRKLLMTAMAVVAFSSCATHHDIAYFQDLIPDDTTVTYAAPVPIRIRPTDQLSIVVSCQDYRLTDLFNLTVPYKRVGSNGTNNYNNGQVALYTVDSDGNIDFPVLGKLHVAGMTREEIATHVHDEITTRNLAKDPVVTATE